MQSIIDLSTKRPVTDDGGSVFANGAPISELASKSTAQMASPAISDDATEASFALRRDLTPNQARLPRVLTKQNCSEIEPQASLNDAVDSGSQSVSGSEFYDDSIHASEEVKTMETQVC